MLKSILKKLIAVILLVLSPFATLAVFGTVYVIIRIIMGSGFQAAVNSFMSLIKSLVPYFPYLTTIPVIMILLGFILRYRNNVRERIEKLIDRR